MKLYAYVRTSVYKGFLESKNLPDTAESYQQFLRDHGTTAIAFNREEDGDYKAVPAGSCVRLWSKMPHEKEVLVLEPKPIEASPPASAPAPHSEQAFECCSMM